MNITKVTSFAVNKGKVKANGIVTLEDTIDLKYILMSGDKGDFISWAGGKAFTKKDGTPGWDSPIYVKDKAFGDKVLKEVVSKYKTLAGGSKGGATASASSQGSESNFGSDDIPF